MTATSWLSASSIILSTICQQFHQLYWVFISDIFHQMTSPHFRHISNMIHYTMLSLIPLLFHPIKIPPIFLHAGIPGAISYAFPFFHCVLLPFRYIYISHKIYMAVIGISAFLSYWRKTFHRSRKQGRKRGTKRTCGRLEAVFGGDMTTAKIQTVKGLRVEIFSLPLWKNTTRPLTVWIVGADLERGLLFIIEHSIIFPSQTNKSELIGMKGVTTND